MATNPYMDQITSSERARRRLEQSGIDRGVRENPEQEASILRLSRETGLPKDVVRRNRDEVERRQKTALLAGSTLGSPILRRQLADPSFAAMAQDDTESLGWFESTVQGARDFFSRVPRAFGAGTLRSSGGAARYLSDVFNSPIGATQYAGLQALAGPAVEIGARVFQGKMNAAADKVRGDPAKSRTVNTLLQGVESIPVSITAAATRSPALGAALIGAVTYGESLARGEQAGLSPTEARAYALTQGGIEAGTEILPLGALLRSLKGSALRNFSVAFGEELLGEQFATHLQDLTDWAVLPENADKTFQDYLDERPSAAWDTLLATASGTAGNFAVVHALAKSTEYAKRALGRRVAESGDAAMAQNFGATLEQAMKIAEASKLRERDFETFQNYIDTVAEGSPVEELYFDPADLSEVLNQAAIDPEVASRVDAIFGERLTEAAQTGVDVRVSLGEVLANFAGTGIEQNLVDIAKIDPLGFSPKAAEAYMQSEGDALKADIEKIVERATADDVTRQEFEQVKGEVLGQLNAVRRFTESTNEAYADLVSATYATMAQRAGKTVSELWQQMPLRVQAEGVMGDALDQSQGREQRAIAQGYLSTEKWKAIKDGAVRQRGVASESEAGQNDRGTDGAGVGTPDTGGAGLALFYHGTRDNIYEGFDLEHANRKDNGWLGRAVYVTDDPKLASSYAAMKAGRGGEQVMPLAIQLDNPYIADLELKQRMRFWPQEDIDAWTAQAKALGHDGVVLVYPDGTSEVAVFDPGKLRSPFAGFDETRQGENNLLAQNALPGTIEIDGEQRSTTNSEGQPIAQTEEGVRNFWTWFGDSKVVDEQGRPLVVYHGTAREINEFDSMAWGATDPELANEYASARANIDSANILAGENVIPIYMRIEQVFDADALPKTVTVGSFFNEVLEQANTSGRVFDIERARALLDVIRDSASREESGPHYSRHDMWNNVRSLFGTDGASAINEMFAMLGFDGVQMRESATYGERGAPTFGAFEPEQIKSVNNTGAFDRNDPRLLYQTAAPDKSEAFREWAGTDNVVRSGEAKTHHYKTGEAIAVEAFHGTARPDRVGEAFLPERATAGPMSYFTSSPELASSYAEGKDDTSIDDEDFNYDNWFKVDIGGESVPLADAWPRLSASEKVRIRKLAPRVQLDYDTGEEIVLGPEGETKGIGSYDWEIRQARGNPLKALVESWLTSGALFDQEARFLEVLRTAGVETKVQMDDPHAKHPSVFHVWIAMSNPLVVDDIPEGVVASLKEAAAKDDALPPEQGRVLSWDKNDVTLREWVGDFLDPETTTHVWTRIPDAVSDVFKEHGYDGIVDWSGKNVGPSGAAEGYPVFIPFASGQVKAVNNTGAFDRNDPRLLYQNDVFYSALERAVEQSSTARAPGQQWWATLQKTPGVKAEELEWTGLEEWLGSQDGPIAREEVLAFVRAGGVQVEEAVLGDADELAVTERVSELRDEAVDRAMEGWEFDDTYVDYPGIEERDGEWYIDGDTWNLFDSEEDAQAAADKLHDEWIEAAREEAEQEQRDYLESDLGWSDFEEQAREELGLETKFDQYTEDGGSEYRELLLTLPEGVRGNPEQSHREHAHFGDHPVVAHIRFKARKGPNGEDIMFLEEVQSDWHQKGREKGYAQRPSADAIAAAAEDTNAARAAYREAREALVNEARRSLVEYEGGLPGSGFLADVSSAEAYLAKIEQAADEGNRVTELHLADVYARRMVAYGVADDGLRGATERFVEAEPNLREASLREREVREGTADGIPDAPFKSTPAWAGLAMKRAIRWAADNGFDQIAWTTGAQQAERYDQLMTLESVRVTRKDGAYQVNPGDANISRLIVENGKGKGDTTAIDMTAEQIREVFGADLGGRMVTLADDAVDTAAYDTARVEFDAAQRAETDALVAALAENAPPEAQTAYDAARERMVAASRGLNDVHKASTVTLEGNDLKMGGEGMKAFYDKMLPNITGKIVKKHGGKVRPVVVADFADSSGDIQLTGEEQANLAAIDAERDSIAATIAEAQQKFTDEGGSVWDFRKQPEIEAEALKSQRLWTEREYLLKGAALRSLPATNLGFDITPELKAAANEGFALFQRNQGAYAPSTDTITLFQTANLSTFLHESGHFFLEMLHRLGGDPSAPQQLKDDWAATLKWFGVTAEQWGGFTLEQKRKHHEKWARSFEAYLFTGKAPSIATQGIFTRFRNWLKAVYKQVTALGHQPTPAIREVFDRMIATDDQIAEMEAARSMAPLFADQESSGMNLDEWRAYQRQGEEATDEAVRELEARSMRDMKWLRNAKGREVNRLKKAAKAKRNEVRKQVAAEVMAEPVYAARLYLTRGQLDGTPVEGPHKFSIEEIEALYPDEGAQATVKNALGYGQYGMLARENGLHPEQVAELFGFTSADHLIREIMAAEDMNAKIEGITEQRLLEEHGDLADDTAIEEAADKAVHNEARARFVATELNALAKAAGKPKLLDKAAKLFARETVNRQRVRDLKPSLYEAAASRAARASEKALKEGNLAAAAAEKRNQLINVHAAKAARDARDRIEKAVDYFRRLDRKASAKSIDPDALDQIYALLEAVDLRRGTTLRQIDSAKSLAAWIQKQRDNGLEPVIDEAMAEALARGKSYKEMTVEELLGLTDAIRNIEHLGRLKTKLLTAKKDRDFGRAVDRAVDAIKGNAVSSRDVELEGPKTLLDRIKKGAYEFLAMHRKFASVIRQMDGFKDGGPLWELFVRGANEAGDREASMRAAATQRLAAILKPVLGKDMNRKVYIPEIGASLTLQGRIAIALNMGNAVNRERVMMGEGWEVDQLDAVLETLTAEQWGVVQQVWDYINSFWPQVAEKERRVTGLVPEKVEAEPLKVNTADGQTLELPGGYYPIKYDADRSTKAEADDAAAIAQQFTRGLYSRATTRRGHTKERADKVKRPVRKDLGVVVQHLTEVIHDLAWHEYLIDANRLLRAKAIDSAVREHYGPETLRWMRNALTDMAAGEVPAANQWEKIVNYLRTGATVAGMGWSISTGLLQPLGLSQSVKRIGLKYVLRGMTRWGHSAEGMERGTQWIYEQSDFMRLRGQTMLREINEIQNKVENRDSPVRDSFFWMIQKLQLVADIPTWVGQYEKSIEVGESHERAVALADQAVLDSQGGGQIKDLAGVQRGGPMQKLWTNFYSYFSTTYNLMAESVGEARLTGNYGRLAVDAWLLISLPAILGLLVRSAIKGDLPDEPEELAAELAKEQVGYIFAMMVGVRDIGSAITWGNEAPAGMAVLGDVANLATQVGQGEVDPAALRAANRLGGVVFHYPASQVQKTVEGLEALADGRTANPAAVALGPSREARAN